MFKPRKMRKTDSSQESCENQPIDQKETDQKLIFCRSTSTAGFACARATMAFWEFTTEFSSWLRARELPITTTNMIGSQNVRGSGCMVVDKDNQRQNRWERWFKNPTNIVPRYGSQRNQEPQHPPVQGRLRRLRRFCMSDGVWSPQPGSQCTCRVQKWGPKPSMEQTRWCRYTHPYVIWELD